MVFKQKLIYLKWQKKGKAIPKQNKPNQRQPKLSHIWNEAKQIVNCCKPSTIDEELHLMERPQREFLEVSLKKGVPISLKYSEWFCKILA